MWMYFVIAIVVLAALAHLIYYFGKRRWEKDNLNNVIEKLSGDMAEKVIYSIPDMIFIVDADYKIRRILNCDPKKLSAPLESVIGMNIHDAVDIEYTVPVLKGIQKSLSSDEVQEVEYAVTFGEVTQFFEGRFKRIEKGLVACFERNITQRKKAEESIRKNEVLMSEVLDNMPMPVYIKDVNNELRYTFWNKNAENLFNRKREEVIGKTDSEIYGEECVQRYRDADLQVVSQRKPYMDQTDSHNPDGEKISSIINKNIISNGIHNWLITTRWDLTDLMRSQDRLKEVNRVNQLILDNANSGLVYINSDFVVEWENIARFEDHPIASKYKPGVICYQSVMRLEKPCPGCVAQRAFRSREIEKTETPMPDGTVIAITASPVFTEEGNRGVVLKYDDVTASRNAAEELKRAKEAAETSDKLKSMFISNMSHEIRTPLNAIVGFSELLIHTEDIEEREEYLSVIKRNNELLLQLINDILDLSKIEAETLEFVYSDVDINEMFRNMELSSNQKINDGAALSIVFEPSLEDCVIYTEKNRIQQVVLNLINNALKFTEKGTIRIGYELKDNGLKFFVSDTGRGIPNDKLNDIFKRFVKLDNFVSGTGLGLSICQTIISRLGGEIGVDSKEGEGSTFWFTLPVMPSTVKNDKADAKTESTVFATNRDPAKDVPVLLIAEDAIDNFKLYQTLLRKKYEIIHAWNGKEAVEMFKQYQDEIDLIIMDIKMPEMNGYEATRLIRQQDADIPIIAASAYAFSEDVVRIMNSGFNDYISKPINKAALMTALENFLRID